MGSSAQEVSERRRAGNTSAWRLPRLILIGDRFTDPERADRIVDAAASASFVGENLRHSQAGRGLWVHLRDRAAPDGLFRECAARLVGRLRDACPSLLLSINGRPAAAEALRCGYHAGSRDPAPTFAGGPRQPCGRSAHNEQEIQKALRVRKGGAQYIVFSPVFDPGSKPGYAGVGLDGLRDAAHCVAGRVPVYALGGVAPDRIGPCLAAGSYGVAVLSGVLQADRPAEAARAYADALSACLGDA